MRRYFGRGKRRRKPVEWIDTNFSSFDFDGHVYGILPLCSLAYGGPLSASPYVPVYNTTPILIGDEPDFDNTLNEERKTYTIRRIVGTLHLAWGREGTVGTGGTNGVHPVMAKWGFAVQSVPPAPSTALAGPERQWETFSSQLADDTEMDWMFKETEVYGANMGETPVLPDKGGPWGVYDNKWDSTNTIQDFTGYSYPVARRHKVDIRVARTVRRNQRIFFNIGLLGFSADDTLYNWKNNPHSMKVWADLRVLINWRAAYNRKG